MDIQKFWQNAVTYETYLIRAEESIAHPKTQAEKDFHEYYKLGVQRMNRMYKSYRPHPEELAELEKKGFSGRILIISEPWCGDASQAIPVISKFFSKNEIRISYRDQEPSLIDNFLTNGSKSIPIVIFLDEQFNEVAHWGPRPAFGRELFAKHKSNPQAYTQEELHNDLQVYYAKNKGKDTIAEILKLL